jgi:hypothetical protein
MQEGWKVIGVICSIIWLLAVGSLANMFFGLILLMSEMKPQTSSSTEVLLMLLVSPLGYILVGIGPVWAMIRLMKKRHSPMTFAYLISLTICAAIPLVAFLAQFLYIHYYGFFSHFWKL